MITNFVNIINNEAKRIIYIRVDNNSILVRSLEYNKLLFDTFLFFRTGERPQMQYYINNSTIKLYTKGLVLQYQNQFRQLVKRDK